MYKYSKKTRGFYLPEINGPDIPEDAIDVSVEDHRNLMTAQSEGKTIEPDEDGYPIAVDPPLPSFEEKLGQMTASVQERLDLFAKTRNYDNCLSCCTYADSNIEKFSTEGQYMKSVRDQHWATGYSILADVQSGQRDIPTKEQLFNELGPLEWPN